MQFTHSERTGNLLSLHLGPNDRENQQTTDTFVRGRNQICSMENVFCRVLLHEAAFSEMDKNTETFKSIFLSIRKHGDIMEKHGEIKSTQYLFVYDIFPCKETSCFTIHFDSVAGNYWVYCRSQVERCRPPL